MTYNVLSRTRLGFDSHTSAPQQGGDKDTAASDDLFKEDGGSPVVFQGICTQGAL